MNSTKAQNSSNLTTTPLHATTTENSVNHQPLVYYPNTTTAERAWNVAYHVILLLEYSLILPALALVFISLKNWFKRMGLVTNGDVRQAYEATEFTETHHPPPPTTTSILGFNNSNPPPIPIIKLAK